MSKERRGYKPRLVGGKVTMPTDLASTSTCSMSNTSTISRMKCVPWSKASGPSWRTSCRRKSRRI